MQIWKATAKLLRIRRHDNEDDGQARTHEATEVWFDQASKHITVAKHIWKKRNLKPLAIFHLSQAIEMTIKGLATASGYSHTEIKGEYGHNYIDLFASMLQKVIEQSGMEEIISQETSVFYKEGSAYDAVAHINNLRNHTPSPGSPRAKTSEAEWRRLYLSAFQSNPNEIREIINMYDQIDKAFEHAAVGYALLKKQVADQNIPDHEVRQELQERIRVLKPTLGLIIVGSILWPHNMPSRYPAPPEADHDASQINQYGDLGVQHYSSNLGAIKHLDILMECCEEIVSGVIRGYREGRIFGTQEAANPTP